MDFVNTIARIFQDGGVFMYPIALVLAVGLAIMLERWFFLTRVRMSNRRAFDTMLPMLKNKEYADAMELAQSTKAPISRIIAAGIDRLQQTPHREQIEYAMEEGVMEALPRLEKRTPYLAIFRRRSNGSS